MKRGYYVGLAVGLLVVLAAFFLLLPRSGEPKYRGKTLSDWLINYGWGNNREQSEAVLAIQKIGTNAIPWLLKWRSPQPPGKPWQAKLASFVNKLPLKISLKDRLRLQRKIAGRGYMVGESLWGFGILGSAAAPAIPEISRLARTSESHWALFALGKIGIAAVPALLDALGDPATPSRFEGFEFIACDHQPDAASAAVPLLVEMLEKNDNQVALAAASTLTRLKEEPKRAAATFVEQLEKGDANARYLAIRYLKQLGREARIAVPQLVANLTHPDKRVRGAATNTLSLIAPEALKTIDPEAAAKAGVK